MQHNLKTAKTLHCAVAHIALIVQLKAARHDGDADAANMTQRVQCDQDKLKPKHKQRVLYSDFQETLIAVPQEDGSTEERKHTRVTLILADKNMLQVARKYGQGRPLFMDTTFAINKYKFSFLSIMAMDNAQKGVPVLWGVLPDESAATIAAVLQVFKDAVEEEELPTFSPSCFMTDDSDAEQKAVACASLAATASAAECFI